MGCTSSKSTVVATNVRRNSEKPSTLAGKTRDANNNEADPHPRAFDEVSDSQKNEDNEVPRNKGRRASESKRIEVSDSQRKKEYESLEKQEYDDIEDKRQRHSKDAINDQSKDNQIETDCGKDGSSLLIVAENEENAGLRLSSSSHDNNDKTKILRGEEKSVKKIGKFQLFSSVQEFKDVDLHALQAPKEKASSFEELARYLTDPYQSDLYKVRSLWRWVTSNIAYDTDAYFSGDISSAADEGNALRTGKAVCSGYSSLVSALCSCVGLECKEIHGHAKGYSYQIGDSFKGAKTNHSWTALKIQGHWWLFDFTWGAGYTSYDKKFVWDYNEHYFMTDPEEFILDHYPKDDEWQLVENKYTIEEYEKWAKFYKHFFNLQFGMDHRNRNGLILSDDGRLEVVLCAHIPVQIDSKLEFVKDGKASVLNNYSFKYVKDNSAVFLARLPHAGDYIMNLYASKLNNDSRKSYDAIARYSVKSTTPFTDLKPFPKTFSSWLPGYVLQEPVDGVLLQEKTYKFCIQAFNVVEMHVSATGGKWTALAETSKGLWEGDVTFDDNVTEATVVVKVEGQTSTTFSGILKYEVKK